MYKTFRVKNFRCFKDLQINDLGRVNLIAGKNNTGKTALMEAMYIFTRPLSPWALFQLQNARGIDVPESDYPLYWKQFFYGMESSGTIRIDASGSRFADGMVLTIQELENNGANNEDFVEYYRRRNRAFTLNEMLKGKNEKERLLKCCLAWQEGPEPLVAYFASDLLRDSVKEVESLSRFFPVSYRVDDESAADRYSQLVVEEQHEALTSELSKIEQRLTRLQVLSPWGTQVLWADIDGINMPLRLLGEGTNRFCLILMTMMAVKPLYLFIDEIENGIHYSLQKDVWKSIGKVARDLEVQVFATTHSLEMIRAAYEAFSEEGKLDEFRYHRLDRDSETREIEAVTYNELDMNAVATFDFDFEVRG